MILIKKTLSLFKLALGFLGFLNTTSAFGSPCCSSSATAPSMITGDDRAQAQISFSHAEVVGDVNAAGKTVFRDLSATGIIESTNAVKLEGAYRLFDRIQAGGSIPFLQKKLRVADEQSDSSGLGDIKLNSSYEILTNWEYSVWKPQGFLYLTGTAPTGRSVYESRDPTLVDARGKGYWTIGVGIYFFKTFENWDSAFHAEGHYTFPRDAKAMDGQSIRAYPGVGNSLLFALGYSPLGGSFRIGASVSPSQEYGVRTVIGGIESRASKQLLWDTTATVTYLISTPWSLSLSYSDQTLLGPAQNVSLSRTAALSVQKRWEL